jgi:hypothetical protein
LARPDDRDFCDELASTAGRGPRELESDAHDVLDEG